MYTKVEKVVTRQIAGETLLIPITQAGADLQKVYLLNETAAAIWELLAQPRELEGLVAALQEQYEAPEEVLRTDTLETLEALIERGFVIERQAGE